MNPLKLRNQLDYSETNKNSWIRYVFQFLKKLKLHTKLVPETVQEVKSN